MSETTFGLPGRLGTRTELATVRVTTVEVVAVPVKKLTEAPGVKVARPLWAAAMKCRGEIMAKPSEGVLVSQPTPERSKPELTSEGEALASGASAGKLVLKRSKRGS